jgi:kinesin family member 17
MESKIKVGVRVRPISSNEALSGASSVIEVSSVGSVISKVAAKKSCFDFDWAFDSLNSEEEIYNKMCNPLIVSLFEGFNGTFFACKPLLKQITINHLL